MANFLSRRQFTIEWGHCDPAGIVFNSRFFEFFDWGTWVLFETALGVKPAALAGVFGITGIPLVDAGARFLAPARFGDVVELTSHCLLYTSNFVDAGYGLAEIVGGEMGERFVKGRCTRGRAAQHEAEGQ